METKSHKVVIRGGYGLSNFGDDALMVNIFEQVAKYYDPSEIVLICKKVSYLSNLLPAGVTVIDYSDIDPSFSSDMLIYGGGTQFYSFPLKTAKDRIQLLYTRPLKHTLSLLKAKINLALHKKDTLESKFQIADHSDTVALVGVGLGPFDTVNNSIENKTEQLFKKAQFISVRDPFAKKKCEAWEIPDFHVYPDICYIESSPTIVQNVNTATSVKNIGIIIRDWEHEKEGRAYEENLLKSAKALRAKNYNVTFISFSVDADKYWNTKLKKIGENNLLWNPSVMNIDFYLQELNTFDLFITARYHGAVYGSLLNKPFIAIEVEQKLKMISELFEGGALCWEKPFEESRLIDHVTEIDNNYVDYVKVVSQKKIALIEQSQELFDNLGTLILTSKK